MDFSIWTMRDGKEIPVKQMTSLHIKNCLGMLQRNLQNHESNAQTIKLLSGLVSVLTPQASTKSEIILDKADTDLMVAEFLLEQSHQQTLNWIKTFEQELKIRETN